MLSGVIAAKAQCLVTASNITPSSCGQNNGVVEMTFSAGTPPYAVNFNGLPLGTSNTTLQINGLGPGSYSFSVTDQNNIICTGDVSVTVSALSTLPPQVTISNMPPSCDTCFDGIITAMAIGTAPFTYLWSNGVTMPNLMNVPCGTYNLVVTDANGCSSLDTIVLNCPGNSKYYMRGKTYYDSNNDSNYNVGDYPLINQMVKLLPSNQFVYSNWNGDYSFLVDTGSYQLVFIPQVGSPFQHVNGLDTISVNVSNQSILNLDFGLFPDSSCSNYVALSNFWLPRCNSTQSLITTVVNNGTTIDSLQIKVVFPSSFVFLSSNSVTTLSADTLTYYISGIAPGQTSYLFSYFLLPAIGNQLPISTYVTAINNGISTSYDTTTVNTQIICGCDPNDKQVSPQLALVGIDSTLNYLIRFQNTGTDTTFKVVVIDTLDANLNPASFKLFATSHPCQVFRENNILRFVFDNILLPDSNSNEAASHGYIFFSVDVEDNSISMTIPNKAHIFFDANADVETPFATSTFVVCVGITEMKNQDLKVFPNPASDLINLNFDWNSNHQYSYLLFDAIGQMIISNQNLTANKINLSADLPKGIYLLEILDNTAQQKFTTKIQIN